MALTKQEIKEKYGVRIFDQSDVRMIIMSNLSDIQNELSFKSKEEISEKINMLKSFMMDTKNIQ